MRCSIELKDKRGKMLDEYTSAMKDLETLIRPRTVNHKIAKLVALATLTCFCSVAGLARISTAASRPIDYATGCPKDGNYSAIFAVLLDTTDSLSPVEQEKIQKKLDEFAKEVPRYGKLEVFSVRAASDRLIEPLVEVCNPGRASDTNQWTGNPRLDEKRWHEKFMDPLDKSLKVALSGYRRCETISYYGGDPTSFRAGIFRDAPGDLEAFRDRFRHAPKFSCSEPIPPSGVFQRI